MTSERIHATMVRLGHAGVLLTGDSGAGKSDLAIRLIDRGGMLVADDQVILAAVGGVLYGDAVPGFAGRIEARGLGILDVPAAGRTRVTHHFALSNDPARMPVEEERHFCGVALPSRQIDARAASAPILVGMGIGMPPNAVL
ncbi:HPr kinase/phosphatase C-terminal domain-containing protein [Pacificimonas sp. WHA3]|uniref:HPr kinase/phosphatase C-terminal domain-containing protein n=1 Tax=Pacificimonas pallii TaxID=2827236 RepID=A0ABS6SGA5_9SPHN|nr:HPr kinase/phosphatase C-terminal domain-containing protein [Pacificimonas pallii]MBV7257434.1 HPr kinase/phosphatase C-terminal domain-containing protein [Pacificimonas pallii]